MKKIFNILFCFWILCFVVMFVDRLNVFAAAQDLMVGTYTSNDGHTIEINEGSTLLYDSTYTLTKSINDRGSTLTGKIGTNNKSVTFYQLNSSKIVSGAVINYTHGGETVYLYDYTVFSLDTTPVVKEDSGIELWSNGSKVNSYIDLQSAVDAAKSGDTIKITKNLDVVGGAYIKGKKLTVEGNNNTLNSAIWSNSIFIVEEDAELQVNNLTIDGGSTGFEIDYDAVTYKNATIPLKSGSDSGDIKQNLSAVITKGVLSTDKMNVNNYYTANGAINVVSGNITLINGEFNHNRVSGKGGSLYIGSNLKQNETTYPVKSVIIDNCGFTLNYSTDGGAIYIYNAASLKMDHSNFISNAVSGGSGGALHIGRQTASGYHSIGEKLGLDFMQVKIDDCLFEKNWVGNDGAAIQARDSELIVSNTIFKNNVGVYSTSSVGTVSLNVYRKKWANEKILNCVFEGNIVPVSGIGDHGCNQIINIEGSTFKNNIGQSTLYFLTAVANVKDTVFINEDVRDAVINVAGYADVSDYAAIEYKRPTLILEDIKFDNLRFSDINVLAELYNLDVKPQLEIKGELNGNIHMWDDTDLTINGILNGDLYIAENTPLENIIINSGKVNGDIIDKNDYHVVFVRFTDENTKQIVGYDVITLYLDDGKTYTDKELYLMHLIGKDNKKFVYYTDSGYTTPWNHSINAGTTIYARLEDHNHVYSDLMLYNNAIYEQCECGYLGKKLSLETPENVTYTGKKIEVLIKNEINLTGYTIKYQMLDKEGKYVDIDGVPIKVGKYKAILTYEDMSIEHNYSIEEAIVNPSTGLYTPYLIMILIIISSFTIYILSKNKKYV